MVNYSILSKKQHKFFRIKATDKLDCASNDNICEIYVDEALLCSESLPIAFIKNNEEDGKENYKLIALCGLFKKKNAFLDNNSKWTGSYIPAIYRSYPYKILKENPHDEKKILCIDTDNDLFTEENEKNSIALFEKNGEPSEYLKRTIKFVSSLEKSLFKTIKLVKMIVSLDLLEEWKITIKNGKKEMQTKGLYKINKNKIKELSKDSLFELNQNNGLELIFSHFISRRNIYKFSQQSNRNILDEGLNIKDHKNEVRIKQEKEKIKEVDNLVQNLLNED